MKTLFYLSCAAFLLIACETGNKRTISPPEGAISPKQAILLNDNYTKTRYDLINRYLGRAVMASATPDSLQKDTLSTRRAAMPKFMDNRSSWWSLKDIEAYIAYAKQEAKNKDYVLDGLRIYQGAYSDTVRDGTKQVGLGTVFIVPTGKKAVGQEGNMLPMSTAAGGGDLKELYPLNEGHPGNPPHASYPQN